MPPERKRHKHNRVPRSSLIKYATSRLSQTPAVPVKRGGYLGRETTRLPWMLTSPRARAPTSSSASLVRGPCRPNTSGAWPPKPSSLPWPIPPRKSCPKKRPATHSSWPRAAVIYLGWSSPRSPILTFLKSFAGSRLRPGTGESMCCCAIPNTAPNETNRSFRSC